MGRNKITEEQRLKHKIFTRINEAKFQELMSLANSTPNGDISEVLRSILYNQRIKVLTYDNTFDTLMQELAKIRTEIKSIGVNINQITRHFNTYPERTRKEFYAKTAFQQYLALNTPIERLFEITSQLAKKWLSE